METDGTRFGDWEMDLIVDQHNQNAMVTLTERKTNFSLIRKISKGKKAKDVADTVYYMLLPYKKTVRTITPDNGPEFVMHKLIAKRLKHQGLLCPSVLLLGERGY